MQDDAHVANKCGVEANTSQKVGGHRRIGPLANRLNHGTEQLKAIVGVVEMTARSKLQRHILELAHRLRYVLGDKDALQILEPIFRVDVHSSAVAQ